MKRCKLLIIIIGLLCFALNSCINKSDGKSGRIGIKNITPSAQITDTSDIFNTSTADAHSEKVYYPTKENVKLIGRTYLSGNTLWLSYSASGIEFTVTGIKADITLKGDNIAVSKLNEDNFCRIGIYVNGELVSDELLKEREKTITAFESDTVRTVTIKVLKLSETTNSTFGIKDIRVNTKGSVRPTDPKAHCIEFIGDSITCGYGVDDNDVNHPFSTATENAAKTYAYKTIEALDADYSMVCISGYGIISGHTGSGDKNVQQLIPKYYDKMGFSYGNFNNLIKVDSVDWDFKSLVPDLIVINLGTNDMSYCRTDIGRQEEFTIGYLAFIKQVRVRNPDSVILCTLGMMGDSLYPCIEEAVNEYIGETGDKKIFCMKFDPQLPSDGYGARWHPSENTHRKAAEKLTAEIKNIMGW